MPDLCLNEFIDMGLVVFCRRVVLFSVGVGGLLAVNYLS